MLKKTLVMLLLLNFFANAIPMESLSEYNLVLIHGAGSHWGGLDCENGDVKHEKYEIDSVGYAPASIYYNYGPNTRIGGKFSEGLISDDSTSSATGMIAELKPWIQDNLFNGDYEALVYLQRPFTNPANSPFNNGKEIGKRTWAGNDKCAARRSLFEESQEVHAGGQDKLDTLRKDNVASYRKIPSRYILVSHSMGGVASREYVQGTNYNYDVDKVVTLDSPHEGTGALNLLLYLKEVDLEERFKNSLTQFIAVEGFTIATYLMGFDELSSSLAILGIALPLASNIGQPLLGSAIAGILGNGFDYSSSDSLISYIDPHSGSTDNVINLKTKGYFENQPMFRLLYGVDGMTFSNPKRRTGVSLGGAVPQTIGMPIGNAYNNLTDGGSGAERFYNTIASAVYGVLAGITIEDHGTALIPSNSGKGKNTAIFNDPRTDVRKESYNGNIMLNSTPADFIDDGLLGSVEDVSAITGELLTITVGFVLAASGVDYALQWNQPGRFAAKAALVAGVSAAIVNLGIANITIGGFGDLNYSHRVPILSHFQKKWKIDANSFAALSSKEESSYAPYLMEDFLYEKPFVNLGLFVSADSLRDVDANCYYEADKADEEQLCEVGLYGDLPALTVRDSLVTMVDEDGSVDTLYNGVNDVGDSVYNDTLYVYGSFLRQNYAGFRVGPLKFKSESEWNSVGVKLDRWERVDGLDPSTNDTSNNSVPIRHVERYNMPAITVDNWIEKYSFVVDDLMPHRLRQIRMNFNFQEEIAWECDITKPDTSSNACTVYARSGSGNWTNPIVFADSVMQVDESGDSVKVERRITIDRVPHPVKKNGQFDFVPGDYGYKNLLAIQKDNQNTVTISTVNKIGLSNTQRFYSIA